MLKESITIDDALSVLNSAVKADPEGMQLLVDTRVPCNEILANHESIQVLYKNDVQPDLPADYLVGLVGILNGMFGMSETGWGIITAIYDGDGLTGFERTPDADLGVDVIAQMSDIMKYAYGEDDYFEVELIDKPPNPNEGKIRVRLHPEGGEYEYDATPAEIDQFLMDFYSVGRNRRNKLYNEFKQGKEFKRLADYMRTPPISDAYPLTSEEIEGTGKIGEEEQEKESTRTWDLLRTITEAEKLAVKVAFKRGDIIEYSSGVYRDIAEGEILWSSAMGDYLEVKRVDNGELESINPSQIRQKLIRMGQSTESNPYRIDDNKAPSCRPEVNRFMIYDIPQVQLEDNQADPAHWDSQIGFDQTMSESEQAELPMVRE